MTSMHSTNWILSARETQGQLKWKQWLLNLVIILCAIIQYFNEQRNFLIYVRSITVNVLFPIGPIPIEILNTNTCIPGMALNFQIFVVTSIYGRFLLFCIFVIRYVTDYLEKCRDANSHWGRSEDEPSLDF